MQTGSYCGRESEDTRAECSECGTQLGRASQAPRDRSVSNKRFRAVLGFIGVGGGLVWLIFSFLGLLFHGFKAGGAQGGMSRGEWALCDAAVLITFIYYAVVSGSIWSRRLLVAGIAVHAVWFVAVVCIVTLSGGGFLFTPLFLGGLACWIAYAATAPHNATPPP